MLLLSLLSGKQAGAHVAARRFPFHIGRRTGSHLCLDDDGVWDLHCTLEVEAADGPSIQTANGAVSYLNGQPIQHAVLRNGDVLDLGSARVRIGLSPVRPKRLRLREVLTWIALAGLGLAQVALIYWMEI